MTEKPAPTVFHDAGDGVKRTYVMSEGECTSVTRFGDVVILPRREVEGRKLKLEKYFERYPADHPNMEKWKANHAAWSKLLED